MDIAKFYEKHHDLYSESVTADHVAGATPAPGWLILRVIPKPAEHKRGGIVMTTNVTASATPVVYQVLAAGEGCRNAVGDLVCITFLSGDRLSGEIALVAQEDIVLTWGEGLRKDGKQE